MNRHINICSLGILCNDKPHPIAAQHFFAFRRSKNRTQLSQWSLKKLKQPWKMNDIMFHNTIQKNIITASKKVLHMIKYKEGK